MRYQGNLRVGLIGLGSVGAVHLEAYKAARGLEVVSIAELDHARLHRFAASSGAKPYASHRDMLSREDLDIACVLTPAAHHLPLALDCAAAGVATLVEKPMSVTHADAERMAEAFRVAGVPLFYGSCYRFLPAVTKARELITVGEIGDILLLTETFVAGSGPEGQRPCSAAHYPPGLPGGTGMGLMDHGVHLIDIFSWLIDSPIVSASGRGNISGEKLRTEYAVLEFENGAIGQLTYNDGTWPNGLPNHGHFSAGAGWNEKGLTPREGGTPTPHA